MSAKSLILVTVDCLRADHAGFMGYRRPVTPFLDSLAAESFVFPRAIVAGAPTFYSFPGLMASRFPLSLGREVTGLAPDEPTIATVLQEAGYRTAAFVAGNPYLGKRSGYARGFETFQDFLSGNAPATEDMTGSSHRKTSRLNARIAGIAHRAGVPGRWYDSAYFQYRHRIAAPPAKSWDALRRFPAADRLVDEAIEWLGSLGHEPFFLWMHFMDPHAPYYPMAEALTAVGGNIDPRRGRYLNAAWLEKQSASAARYREEIVRLYDAGIRWVDTQLQRLVESIRSQARWDSSIFAFTADHGEEFLEHGGRFHFASHAYQELLHVPLLLRVPGTQPTALSAAPFSQLHLAPTLLEAMDMGPPAEFAGTACWAAMRRGGGWTHATSESVANCTNPFQAANRIGGSVLAVQDERFKLLLDFERDREYLFDLADDPGEQRPLSPGSQRAPAARLLQLARQHLAGRRQGAYRDAAIRARLCEIGLEWKHSTMNAKTLAS